VDRESYGFKEWENGSEDREGWEKHSTSRRAHKVGLEYGIVPHWCLTLLEASPRNWRACISIAQQYPKLGR
jgi:hypothetical protein